MMMYWGYFCHFTREYTLNLVVGNQEEALKTSHLHVAKRKIWH